MDDNIRDLIARLESEWSHPDGFIGAVRYGDFDPTKAARFLALLRAIKVPDEDSIDRRLVALLWYIPLVLEWQGVRAVERGEDVKALQSVKRQVLGILEHVLGAP